MTASRKEKIRSRSDIYRTKKCLLDEEIPIKAFASFYLINKIESFEINECRKLNCTTEEPNASLICRKHI